jgi:ParB family chromosome partitioning protein
MAALGRGLSSLIPLENDFSLEDKKPTKLFIESILPNPFQPRKVFDDEALQELAQSIRENGVIQPVVVRKKNDGYELIAGERRCRASKIAGLDTILAIVIDIDDKKALEFAIIENVQRQDLSAMEEATSYQRLIDEFHYTQEELSKIIGKSRSQIANFLRLNHLPESIKNHLNKNAISYGHARAVLNTAHSEDIINEVIKNHLSVRQTEELVKRKEKIRLISKKAPPKKLEIVKNVEDVFQKVLNLKTTIKPRKDGTGEIIISFNNSMDLKRLLDKLGVEVKD